MKCVNFNHGVLKNYDAIFALQNIKSYRISEYDEFTQRDRLHRNSTYESISRQSICKLQNRK